MTTVVSQFFPNLYRDSVALMQLSSRLGRLPGIEEASALMATRANLQLMQGAGLLDQVPDPRPNDVLLVLRGEAAAAAEALQAAAAMFDEKAQAPAGEARREPLRSIRMAVKALSATSPNLVLISTPGDYAAAEAMKALQLGLNVMIFSDNVPVQAEVELKRYARSRQLLVMGPDCGTAIVSGVPLAFANVVRSGPIGLIGASGTGTQEVSCLIHQFGGGITHALGTGGHDLSEAVGGLTMLGALEQLAADEHTRVVVLISKPPAPGVAETVLRAAAGCGKPVVACFLGADPKGIQRPGVFAATTLEEAARRAVALCQGKVDEPAAGGNDGSRARALAARLGPDQTCLRGLYTGGTFCYEALLMLQDVLPDLQSNTPTGKVRRMSDVWVSRGNTIIDLGDDDFTRGRPHPMIDPGPRNERLLVESADPQVAIVLLDFVLGHGSHPDPAFAFVPALSTAREQAARAGRQVLFIGHVCGTELDPQDLNRQRTLLQAAGVELTTSNAEAVGLCRDIFAILRAGA